jgi:hypothetical protein
MLNVGRAENEGGVLGILLRSRSRDADLEGALLAEHGRDACREKAEDQST